MAPALTKLKARELIVVPRLPAAPKVRTGNPWTTIGDIVIDCGVPGCGWHAMGPRSDMDSARREHYRQFHASAQEAGVFRLNYPR
jgi:hypothetical protein